MSFEKSETFGPFETSEEAFNSAKDAGFEMPGFSRPIAFHTDADGIVCEDIPTAWWSSDRPGRRLVVDIGILNNDCPLLFGDLNLDQIQQFECDLEWPRCHTQSWVIWHANFDPFTSDQLFIINLDEAEYQLSLTMEMDGFGIGSKYSITYNMPPKLEALVKAVSIIQ